MTKSIVLSKITTIHQFHAGSAYGDAITNGLFFTRDLLRELGFISEIYVEHVAPELKNQLNHFSKYNIQDNSLLFLHHSMGHDLDEWIQTIKNKIWLIYHNITPPTFFPENSLLRYYAKKGLEQLKYFQSKIETTLADSPFNAIDLNNCGYTEVKVLPLLFHLENFRKKSFDISLVQKESQITTILFIGRFAPNKGQLELIQIAKILRLILKNPFQLVLVGQYDLKDPYVKKIQLEIEKNNLESYIKVTGKILEKELYAWYRAADLFICMSQHEGFGVPLIEAMTFNIPVIALNNSNISHTLKEAGILIHQYNPAAIAALIKLILSNRPLYRKIIANQKKHISSFSRNKLLSQLVDLLVEKGIEIPNMPKITGTEIKAETLLYQIEGPIESSDRVSVITREMGLALEKIAPNQVSLFATKGPGDYIPDEKKIHQHPEIIPLLKKGCKEIEATLVIRNLYPPRVTDMKNNINLLYFSCEDSPLPYLWIEQFNRKLDGILASSLSVLKILRDNGVSIPISVIGEASYLESAQKILLLEEKINNLSIYPTPPKKLAWISSWNTPCDIATYSASLIKELDPVDFDITLFASKDASLIGSEDVNVKPCWADRSSDTHQLLTELEQYSPDIIMIQSDFGLLSLAGLALLVETFETRGTPVLITFHSTKEVSSENLEASLGSILPPLKKASRLLVHEIKDLNRLNEWGLRYNASFLSPAVQDDSWQKIANRLSGMMKGLYDDIHSH